MIKGRRQLRTLGTLATGKGLTAEFSKVLAEVSQGFAISVRDELMEWAAKEIPKRTAQNIKKGYRESKYPSASESKPVGRLAKTVRAVYQPGKDTLRVNYGGDLEYAGAHNAPRGTFREIHANGKLMTFPDRRGYRRKLGKVKLTRARTVLKPGKAVFDEAVDSVVRDVPEKMASIIRRNQNKLLRSKKYLITDTGVKVRVRTRKRR